MRDIMANEAALFEIASSQTGYFTTAQARSCGYSWALLSHHAAGGRFLRVRPGLYRFRQYPSSPREQVMAAWLSAGRETAVVSHDSALDILGLGDIIPQAIHLTIPRSQRSRRPQSGVTIHTSTKPVPANEVVVRDGVAVTSPIRTILDVAELGGAPDQVIRAVREAISRGLVIPEQVRHQAGLRSARVKKLIDQALSDVPL